jgi:transposase
MAMRVSVRVLGVDVSKDWLDIGDGEQVVRIDNTPSAIRSYLRRLQGAVRIGIESTGRYHWPMTEAALGGGHVVYLVDPYRLSKYREGVGVRIKTDAADAQLLARYVAAEHQSLMAFRCPPKAVRRLRALLGARARVTRAKVMLSQSLGEVAELGSSRRSLIGRLDHMLSVIDRKLLAHVDAAGYGSDYRRCLTVPGIGTLNAVGLVATYHRGDFRNGHAFVAYLGLDVRVRDSGKYRGQRKLTKRGPAEIRRLLFNAARSAARSACWRPYYDSLRERGLSTTAAYVALARKLARLAYALLRDQTIYRKPVEGCPAP